ncbi:hypothetical protein [Streptomyces sp. NPDC048385]|uniref:hypothetical protein n=1 Tax=unclassified Streptomyces TaxID=2593676 RepID=UPI00342FFDD0
MNRPARRSLRAWLITPAVNAGRFEKAKSSGADVALADLEDSVAPPTRRPPPAFCNRRRATARCWARA